MSRRYEDIKLDQGASNSSKLSVVKVVGTPSTDGVDGIQRSQSSILSVGGGRSSYQMTIAGGFLDFALFVADAEHLKFLIDSGKEIKYYTFLLTLLIASLSIQLIVVILLFIVGFKQSKSSEKTITRQQNESDGSTTVVTLPANNGQSVLNNVIVVLVTLIAIINVFITVFGDRSEATLMARYKLDMARYNVTLC